METPGRRRENQIKLIPAYKKSRNHKTSLGSSTAQLTKLSSDLAESPLTSKPHRYKSNKPIIPGQVVSFVWKS